MFSRIQRVVSPYFNTFSRFSSSGSCKSRIRINTYGSGHKAVFPLSIQPQIKGTSLEKPENTAILSNFISYNILDELSSMTLYPKTKVDFKSYYSIDKTILDSVSIDKTIDLPQHNNLEINDELPKSSIEDAHQKITPMKLHKGDLYWRRRRMRRHRLLRWRKRYKKLVLDRLQKRLTNREEKQKEDLKSAWQAFGLNDEPPQLTPEEVERLVTNWENQGILIGLKRDEMLSFRKIEMIRKATDEGT